MNEKPKRVNGPEVEGMRDRKGRKSREVGRNWVLKHFCQVCQEAPEGNGKSTKRVKCGCDIVSP